MTNTKRCSEANIALIEESEQRHSITPFCGVTTLATFAPPDKGRGKFLLVTQRCLTNYLNLELAQLPFNSRASVAVGSIKGGLQGTKRIVIIFENIMQLLLRIYLFGAAKTAVSKNGTVSSIQRYILCWCNTLGATDRLLNMRISFERIFTDSVE